jgi:hypothetical protein
MSADYETVVNQRLIVAGSPAVVRKTITFAGTAGVGAVGAVPLFTITGKVLVLSISGFCTVDLTEAAPTATLALGVTGSTSLFIGATTATGIDVGEFWVSTTPTAIGIALPAGLQNMLINADIIGTVAAQAIPTGAIEMTVWYRPISLGATLVAA